MHLNKGCPWKKTPFCHKSEPLQLASTHGSIFTFSLFQFEAFKMFVYMDIKFFDNSSKIPMKFWRILFIWFLKMNFHQVLTRRQGNTQIWIIICHNSLEEVFQKFHWWQKQANLVLQNMKKHFEKMVKTTSQPLLKYWWRKIINLVTCTSTSTYLSMKAVCFVLFCIVL
jgi:hypothetical protein